MNMCMYPTLRLLIECIPPDSLSAYTLASFLGFPALEHEYVYAGREWYRFSCDHELRPEFLEKKGSILCVVRPNFVFNALCVQYLLPDSYLHSFSVFGYAHTQLSPLSTLDAAHVRKNTTCTTSNVHVPERVRLWTRLPLSMIEEKVLQA